MRGDERRLSPKHPPGGMGEAEASRVPRLTRQRGESRTHGADASQRALKHTHTHTLKRRKKNLEGGSLAPCGCGLRSLTTVNSVNPIPDTLAAPFHALSAGVTRRHAKGQLRGFQICRRGVLLQTESGAKYSRLGCIQKYSFMWPTFHPAELLLSPLSLK